MTIISFNPLAEQELTEAASRYEEQKPGLGLEFLETVENSVSLLKQYPAAGPKAQGSIRHLILPRFPYHLLYRIVEEGQIRILAVAHHERRPKYWVRRK